MSEKECILDIPVEHLENIFGQFDANIKLIEQTLSVTFIARDDRLKVIGEEDKIKSAADIMQRLYALSKKGETITKQEVNYLLGLTEQKLPTKAVEDLADDCICHTTSGKPIKPKTIGQKAYVDAIRDQMITFGIGPAGTGKTYLAMAMAITAFQREEVSRIILTRPAIEAGEKLGFLPGDMQSKVDPYLRPLYDALYQIMGAESFARNMEKGLIEVAPLAYMRGRTLDNAFIILDEAQNTTPAQMKMFLTRIGFGSKAVITGDATQKDLPASVRSGLDVAVDVLSSVDEISICKLSGADVVRHPLVQKIVHAYEVYEKKEETKNKKKKVGKTHGKDRGRK
ncbi:MAG: PhoH family protein [Roseburia lenta]|nr:PhoH family protein [Roseburia lenta]